MKERRWVRISWLLLGILLFSVRLVSADNHIESSDGPLSNDGLAPTAITGTIGSNIVDASVGNFPDVRYFSITVPIGAQISAITLTEHVGGDGGSWFAAMAGPHFTENSTNSSEINVDNLLGHAVVGTSYGTLPYDVLPAMSLIQPLGAGTYAFRYQNWGSGINFALDFTISEAPTAVRLAQTQHTTHSATVSAGIVATLFLSLLTLIQLRPRTTAGN